MTLMGLRSQTKQCDVKVKEHPNPRNKNIVKFTFTVFCCEVSIVKTWSNENGLVSRDPKLCIFINCKGFHTI